MTATPGHPLLTAIERYRGGPFADLAEPQTLVQAVRALLDMTDEHPAPGVLRCLTPSKAASSAGITWQGSAVARRDESYPLECKC